MAGKFEGLSDLEWNLFADIFPPEPTKRGRGMPPTPFRKVVNTSLYVLITGCRWCDLPNGAEWASRSAAHRCGSRSCPAFSHHQARWRPRGCGADRRMVGGHGCRLCNGTNFPGP
jgi:transposase